jgi:hypothetical protein
MYTDEYDGKLIQNKQEPAWYYPIRSYYGNTPDLLECPSVRKASNPGGSTAVPPYGGTFLGWGSFYPKGAKPVWDCSGSYGLNHWAHMCNQETCKEPEGASESGTEYAESSFSWTSSADANGVAGTSTSSWSYSWSYTSCVDSSDTGDGSRFWNSAYAKGANNIPLVLDCWWMYAHCRPGDPPPESDAIPRVDVSTPANYLCMNRHSGGIGVVFMDWSVRKVGLKELWTLKWHPQYNVNGRWTRAGGVRPQDWPGWMRKFRDY